MKYAYLFLVAVISGILLWTNISLYGPAFTRDEEYGDIVRQLNFLEKELKEDHLGRNMQMIFPEGYVFIYALYGLTWAELAQADTVYGKTGIRAINEAIYAYESIDSNTGKSTFSPSLNPEYGIYYSGWRNYLLAKILQIQNPPGEVLNYTQTLKARCEEIAKAFRQSKSPYLSSYPGQSWPADSFLAMASLAIHDKLFGPVYREDITNWLHKVRALLDKETGLLAHKTDAESGMVTETSRGGSMALMLRLLAEIDTDLAYEQYALFKKHFVSTALGLPMVREYPKGSFGLGDIDSGPVILGTGFAGTIVSIGTYRTFGEPIRADRQYRTVTAFGLARTDEGHKSYLLGMLPMADAFIAWSRAAPVLRGPEPEEKATAYWRLSFQLKSLFIITLLIAFYFRKTIIARAKQKLRKHRNV